MMTLARARKALVGIALLVAVLLFVDKDALLRAFLQIGVIDLVVLLAISMVLIAVSVVKWRLFLIRLGIDASFARLFRLYLVGYFVNLFMPSFIGGDVVRSISIGQGADRTHSVSATVLERYTGVAAMLAMALCASMVSGLVTPEIRIVVVAVSCSFVVLTWLIFSGFVEGMASRSRLPEGARSVVAKVGRALSWGVADRALLVKAFLWSVLFHVLTVVNTVAVAHAVGWSDAPWRALMIVVPLILLVGAIPISPQGLGIQEGAFAFFLHGVGATPEQAVAVALVLRAKSYVLAALGGLAMIGLNKNDHATSARGSDESLG